MGAPNRVPDLKELLGAMIFAANRPVGVREMRSCLLDVAKEVGQHTAVFADVKDSDVRRALEELGADLAQRRCGFLLAEVAGGYRLQSDESCGEWLKQLLNARSGNRLSRPALETLAIIAYRQPIARSEIEAIRGVSIDHVIKALMELQLVRIVGRSELPGRPFLYGTTQSFLDHFGLKDLNNLSLLTGLPVGGDVPKKPAAKAAPAVADGGAVDRADGDDAFEDDEDDDDDYEDDDEDEDAEDAEDADEAQDDGESSVSRELGEGGAQP